MAAERHTLEVLENPRRLSVVELLDELEDDDFLRETADAVLYFLPHHGNGNGNGNDDHEDDDEPDAD